MRMGEGVRGETNRGKTRGKKGKDVEKGQEFSQF